MSFALFILTLVNTPSNPENETKVVRFIGFSRNEAAAAFSVEYTRNDPSGFTDTYQVVRLVETSSNRPVATYRSKSIRRSFVNKPHRRPTQKSVLATANPKWRDAHSRAEWQRLRRKGRFSAKPLRADDSTLRLARDADAPGELTAETAWIDFVGEPGGPVGFRPVLRLMNGELANLGAFRVDGDPDEQWRARVMVFHSRSGLSVATLTQFCHIDGSSCTWQGRVAPLAEPAGTTAVGTMNLVFSGLRQAQGRYKQLHPKYGDLYDQYVGRHW